RFRGVSKRRADGKIITDFENKGDGIDVYILGAKEKLGNMAPAKARKAYKNILNKNQRRIDKKIAIDAAQEFVVNKKFEMLLEMIYKAAGEGNTPLVNQLRKVAEIWRHRDAVEMSVNNKMEGSEVSLQGAIKSAQHSINKELGMNTEAYAFSKKGTISRALMDAAISVKPEQIQISLKGSRGGFDLNARPYVRTKNLVEVVEAINSTLSKTDVPTYTDGHPSRVAVAMGQTVEIANQRSHHRRSITPKEFAKEWLAGLSPAKRAEAKQSLGRLSESDREKFYETYHQARTSTDEDRAKFMSGVASLEAGLQERLPSLPTTHQKMTNEEAFEATEMLVAVAQDMGWAMADGEFLQSITSLAPLGPLVQSGVAERSVTKDEFIAFQMTRQADPLAVADLAVSLTPENSVTHQKIKDLLPQMQKGIWEDRNHFNINLSNLKDKEEYINRKHAIYAIPMSTLEDIDGEVKEKAKANNVSLLKNTNIYSQLGLFMPVKASEEAKFRREFGDFKEKTLDKISLEAWKQVTIGDIVYGRSSDNVAKYVSGLKKGDLKDELLQKVLSKMHQLKKSDKEPTLGLLFDEGLNQKQQHIILDVVSGKHMTVKNFRDVRDKMLGLVQSAEMDEAKGGITIPLVHPNEASRKAVMGMPLRVALAGFDQWMGYLSKALPKRSTAAQIIALKNQIQSNEELITPKDIAILKKNLTGPSFLAGRTIKNAPINDLRDAFKSAGLSEVEVNSLIGEAQKLRKDKQGTLEHLKQDAPNLQKALEQKEVVEALAAKADENQKISPEKIYGLFGLGTEDGGRLARFEGINDGDYRMVKYYDNDVNIELPIDDLHAWDLASVDYKKSNEAKFDTSMILGVEYIKHYAQVLQNNDSTLSSDQARVKAQRILFDELRKSSSDIRSLLKYDHDEALLASKVSAMPKVMERMNAIRETFLNRENLSQEFWGAVQPVKILVRLDDARRALDKLQDKASGAGGVRSTVASEILGEGPEALSNVREDFSLVSGQEMLKKGVAAAEMSRLDDGSGVFRFRGTALKKKGKYDSYIADHEIPHEFGHFAVDLLGEKDPKQVAQLRPNLELAFGEGIVESLIDESDQDNIKWRDNVKIGEHNYLRIGPDGTLNESLATLYSLRNVGRHNKRQDEGTFTPVASLTG
ncbi:MAG: hypothetical protein KAR32_09760, partial [Candidatus Omnitrophica bacterium]|nr:hypothetical protein [Candidatus Omnitrophota bacterium]